MLTNRLEAFLGAMAAHSLSAALIHRPENMRYLTGYTGEGCLFVSREAQAILTGLAGIREHITENIGAMEPS